MENLKEGQSLVNKLSGLVATVVSINIDSDTLEVRLSSGKITEYDLSTSCLLWVTCDSYDRLRAAFENLLGCYTENDDLKFEHRNRAGLLPDKGEQEG